MKVLGAEILGIVETQMHIVEWITGAKVGFNDDVRLAQQEQKRC